MVCVFGKNNFVNLRAKITVAFLCFVVRVTAHCQVQSCQSAVESNICVTRCAMSAGDSKRQRKRQCQSQKLRLCQRCNSCNCCLWRQHSISSSSGAASIAKNKNNNKTDSDVRYVRSFAHSAVSTSFAHNCQTHRQ